MSPSPYASVRRERVSSRRISIANLIGMTLRNRFTRELIILTRHPELSKARKRPTAPAKSARFWQSRCEGSSRRGKNA